MLKQGEIWLANLNPGKGSEPGKTRAVLVVQGQALLDAEHLSTLVVPLTTNIIDDAEPLRIRVVAHGALKQDSDLLIDQLRAVDNLCLTSGPLTRCDDKLIARVHEAICDVLGI